MTKEIIRKIDGITLKLRKADSFINKTTGEKVEYDDAIIISAGKKDVQVTALFIAGLRKILECDAELLEELGMRLAEERKTAVDVTGANFGGG